MPESMRVPYKIEQLRLLYETQRAETMSWRQAQFVSCLQSIKDVQRSILSAENRIAELEKAIGESVFYAQIDGSVIAVHKLNEGDNVFSGEEIARIVPEGEDKLKAELYVSSDDIAKIQNGNAVYLSFSSLPPEIYGFLKTDIAFIPSDCTASKGNEAVFSVLTDDFSATLSEKRGKERAPFERNGHELQNYHRQNDRIAPVFEKTRFYALKKRRDFCEKPRRKKSIVCTISNAVVDTIYFINLQDFFIEKCLK